MTLNWWWVALVIVCSIPVVLYVVYLLTRVITSAAFRSWWEAKTEMEKKLKHNKEE